MSTETAVLLISCPDQKGLVAAVSEFVYKNGGNIVHAEQHVDREETVFFHRVEWELNGFSIAPPDISSAFRPTAERFGMKWNVRFSYERPRVVLFVSKFDHCLIDLLYRYRVGELNGQIVAVISNHPDLEPQVKPFGIPYHLFPVTAENKAAQEEKELSLLQSLRVELVVLARYMQVLSTRFVRCYPNRIINIHHSFLPAFVGAKPYHQAYERGVKLIGATSHYVTEVLDEGPIIEQDVCRVTHGDSLDTMISKGRELERQVLGRAVRLHLQHRVLPYGRKTVVFD
ncbi:MAG TPA: formyltetrahydrofolate deformylase [Terriglobales bacterium]|nr:formyltetrahydrofolate deformylase [Terriglobales bacterium]